MKILKNKKILLILPVIIISLIVLLLIPNTGATYKEELSVSVNLNIENSTYRVVFNGNGSTSGTTESKTCEYSVNCKLSPNGYKRDGYIFDGWSTTIDGEKVYENEDSVLNLALTGDYQLYARWIQVWAKDLSYNSLKKPTSLDCNDSQCALDSIAQLLKYYAYSIKIDVLDSMITVNVTKGNGLALPYDVTVMYSLDNENWQSSNIFNGLSKGEYTVYAKITQNDKTKIISSSVKVI